MVCCCKRPMHLCNVYNVLEESTVNIGVKNGHITSVDNTTGSSLNIDLENALVIPGIINSHDHLDFNSFPQTANSIYANYTQWGRDIHQNNKTIIEAVIKIPKQLRTAWGIYKNLLAGVTTVVNHGEKLDCQNDIITVYQKGQSLHSAAFEKNWKWKLNNPFNKKKVAVIHCAEGTDAAAAAESNIIAQWNFLKRPLVAVHGVTMPAAAAVHFNSLVWCPDSNFFLLGATARIDELKHYTNILFGMDATLTAHWNMWEHLRLAQHTGLLSPRELMQSITTNAATAWQINTGRLTTGTEADMVILQPGKKELNNGAVFNNNPEDILLVLHKGNIRLFDAAIKRKVAPLIDTEKFTSIIINGAEKFVYGNLPLLVKKIKAYYPDAAFPFAVN